MVARSALGFFVLATMGVSGMFLAAGCSKQLMVCPFHDELVLKPVSATTASAEGARAANVTPTMRVREHSAKEIHPFDGAVTHAPLYFEDPFDDHGSEDGKFAWTGEDYLHIFYWRGRFLANAILIPWSLVDTPPWQVMVSDGKPSRRVVGQVLDADRYTAPASNESAEKTPNDAPAETGG